MLTVIVGAKGGVGTTSVTVSLARTGRAVGADLAAGQLAARLGRRTWPLERVVFALAGQQRQAVDAVVRRRPTLLWTPSCALEPERTVAFVRAVAARTGVVVDGGIDVPLATSPQPPWEELLNEADAVVIVTEEESEVADYHVQRLKERFPRALSTLSTREATQRLTERLAGVGRAAA
jgi:hypothetical protein